MIAAFERLTGVQWRGQGPAFLVASGHAATHWIMAVMYVLLPFIAKDLGLSYAEAGGLISVFHGASFIANAGSGAVVDITGRKVLIQALSLVFGGAALMAVGLASGIWLLVGLLVIIGLSNNLWHPAAMSFLSARYPASRGFALSVHTLGASFGDMIAPVAAGGMLTWMTWQGTASVSALPVFAVAVLLLFTLSGGTGAVVGGASEPSAEGGAKKPADHTMSFGEYLTGAVGLFRNRAVLGICIMSAFRSMAQNGLLIFLPLYMADVLGFTPVLLGVALMVLQIGGFIAGPIAGIVSDRIGRQPIVLVAMASTTGVIASLTFVHHEFLFIAVMAVLGFVLFAVRPVIHSWTMDLTPKEMGGSAISLLFGTQSAFSALVPVVGGLIADTWGLQTVFYLFAGFVFASTLMTLRLPDPSLRAKS